MCPNIDRAIERWGIPQFGDGAIQRWDNVNTSHDEDLCGKQDRTCLLYTSDAADES